MFLSPYNTGNGKLFQSLCHELEVETKYVFLVITTEWEAQVMKLGENKQVSIRRQMHGYLYHPFTQQALVMREGEDLMYTSTWTGQ